MLKVSARVERLGEPVVTGYSSSHFRHSCDRNGCYYKSLPCWDDLIDCFPRRIRPTDVDGMVEIGGRFLFLEEKRAGVAPDEGQRRALLRLSRQRDVTVVFFRPGKSSELEVLIFGQGDPQGFQPCTREEFRAWLRGWALAADSPFSPREVRLGFDDGTDQPPRRPARPRREGQPTNGG